MQGLIMRKSGPNASMNYLQVLFGQAQRLLPGLLISLVIALASAFIAEHYGGPTLLLALLFGMSCHFLMDNGSCLPGIEFTSRVILRLGIALLGAQITLGQIGELGIGMLLGALLAVATTIAFGWFAARLLGLRSDFGVLTGGAVAICGASAALAISAILPKHENSERHTLLTVVGVTSLSTLAMILYPILTASLGLTEEQTGIFLGGAIHDVAQVVGAGYMISPLTGDTATLVKLLRVALLVPCVIIIGWIFYYRQVDQKAPGIKLFELMPVFLLAFVALVIINSFDLIPSLLTETMGEISRGCLILAISALGVKTSLKDLVMVGWRPIFLLFSETLFLAILVLLLLYLIS